MKKYIKLNIILLSMLLLISSCSKNNTGENDESSEYDSQQETTRYNWNNSSSTESEITITGDYKYDNTMLYAVPTGFLNDEEYKYYKKTVDAIIAYENEIVVQTDYVNDIKAALRECFPPYFLCDITITDAPAPEESETESETIPEETSSESETETQPEETSFESETETQPEETSFESETETQPEDTSSESETETEDETEPPPPILYSAININYHNAYEDHVKKITDFFSMTASIVGKNMNKSKELTAINLYSYVSSTIKDIRGMFINSYEAIMGNFTNDTTEYYSSGGTHSAVYTYLMLQSGIDCATTEGFSLDTKYIWCAFSLNDSYFYADPCCEYINTNGLGLLYFGFTSDFRYSEGYSNPPYITGMKGKTETGEMNFNDLRYSIFRNCYYYEVDPSGKSINAYCDGLSVGEYMFE